MKYRGSDSFKTRLGAFLSIATFAIILFNLTSLCLAWYDGDKQDEYQSYEVFDRFKEPAQELHNKFNITIVNVAKIPTRIARMNVF